MLSGDNSILQRATDAKTKSDEAQIKERVRLAYSSALTKDLTNGNGDLTKPTLDEEINNEFGSSGKVEKDGDEWVIYVDNNEIERISIPESDLKPTLISQGAKVGDYVNYNASSGNGANLQVTASDIAEIVQTIDNTDDDTKFAGGATISGTFKSNEISKWRIISTENGIIKLMGEVPTTQTVTLQGTYGFNKSIQVLDRISGIYGNGDGATSAKSIALNDIALNYNNIYINTNSKEYSSGNFFKQIIENEKVIGYEDNLTQATETNPILVKGTAWASGGPNMFNNIDGANIWWTMHTTATASNDFWIASKSNYADSDVCGNCVFSSTMGGIQSARLINSDGRISDANIGGATFSVMPVITLKTGIRGEKAQDGSWNLDV